MASIFISYRRDDAGGHAGRLCDRLTARFGDDRVFMDIQDIAPGQNFARSIDQTIAACDCVLAVIGPRWLDSIAARDGADDYVRRELVAALTSGVTLVPILVGGARMPTPAQLPPELAELSRRNALELRDEHFDDDIARLTSFLVAATGPSPAEPPTAPAYPRRAMLAGLAIVLAAVAAAAFWATRSAPPPAPPRLEGAWVAEMQKQGQPPYRFRLEFRRGPAGYVGTVRYPTGDGTVQDVALDGTRLAFKTVHLPQFESAPATIAYQGTLEGGAMQLTGTDAFGVAIGVAHLDEPSPAPGPRTP
jgi:hypothetical protein